MRRGSEQGRGRLGVLAGRGIPALCLLAVLFAACRTPPPPLRELKPAAALPTGADLYFSLSIPENRDFLQHIIADRGLGSRGSDYFLRRAQFVYGAAHLPSPDSSPRPGPRLLVAAEGDFSRSLVEFGVRRERGWTEEKLKTARGPLRYYQNNQGAEIAAPADGLILLSLGGEITPALERLFRGTGDEDQGLIPPEYLARSFALRFSRPRGHLSLPLGGILDNFLYNLTKVYGDRTEGQFTLSGEAVFSGPGEATAAAVLLRLVFSGLLLGQGLDLPQIRSILSVDAEGETVFFSGLQFSEESVTDFLNKIPWTKTAPP